MEVVGEVSRRAGKLAQGRDTRVGSFLLVLILTRKCRPVPSALHLPVPVTSGALTWGPLGVSAA